MLAVARQSALGRRLAEASVRLGRPPVEHPALRPEAAKGRLDTAHEPVGTHALEHVSQGNRGITTEAVASSVACGGAVGREVAQVDEVAGGIRRRQGTGGRAVDDGEKVIAVDEGDADVGVGQKRAKGTSPGQDDRTGVLDDGRGRAERKGTEGEGTGGEGTGGEGTDREGTDGVGTETRVGRRRDLGRRRRLRGHGCSLRPRVRGRRRVDPMACRRRKQGEGDPKESLPAHAHHSNW